MSEIEIIFNLAKSEVQISVMEMCANECIFQTTPHLKC